MTKSVARVLAGLVLVGVASACSDNSGPSPIPAGVVITPGDTLIPARTSTAYHATLVDSAGQPLTFGAFTWTSDDTTIATVSATGVVTAKQIGLADIYATSDTLSGFVTIQVVDSLITTRLFLGADAAGLAVSGSKAYVTLVTAGSLAVLNVPAETATGRVVTGYVPTGVTFNAAGTRAYVTNQGGTLGVLDAAANTKLSSVPIPGAPFVDLTSADDATVWVTSGSLNRVYALNATTLTIVDSAVTPVGPNGLARHPTLPRLYVSGSVDGKVYELDATTLDSLRSWSLGGSAQGMVVSADGSRLFVANELGWIDVITLASGAVGTPVAIAGSPFGLALSPDGTRLATSCTSGSVVVLNSATLAVIQTINTQGIARRLAYRADGTRLLVANEAGWVDFIR